MPGCILILNLIATNRFMHSLPFTILLYLAMTFHIEGIFKPGTCRPGAWFPNTDSVRMSVCVCVCLCVCVSTPEAINN